MPPGRRSNPLRPKAGHYCKCKDGQHTNHLSRTTINHHSGILVSPSSMIPQRLSCTSIPIGLVLADAPLSSQNLTSVYILPTVLFILFIPLATNALTIATSVSAVVAWRPRWRADPLPSYTYLLSQWEYHHCLKQFHGNGALQSFSLLCSSLKYHSVLLLLLSLVSLNQTYIAPSSGNLDQIKDGTAIPTN